MKIECPNCKQKYEVDNSMTGQPAKCECGNRIIIPSADVGEFTWFSKPSFWGYFPLYCITVTFFVIFAAIGCFLPYFMEDLHSAIPMICILFALSLVSLFGLIFLICSCHTTKYSVINNNIVRNYGVFAKNEDIIRIVDIRKISHSQSFTQFLFGIGNVNFDSAGGSIFFSDLKKHKELAKKVESLQAKNQCESAE